MTFNFPVYDFHQHIKELCYKLINVLRSDDREHSFKFFQHRPLRKDLWHIFNITIMSLKQTFISEVNHELQKHPIVENGLISEKEISRLPSPVQKFFHFCGYTGKPKMSNVQILWKDVFLKMSPEKDWTAIKCYQFNAVAPPARLVFMKSKIGGLFPFEGRDKYQDGHGNMLIKLLKLFTVGDSKGKEMDESALVTILAEALFLPAYALQPYIHWHAIDDRSAGATITDSGIQVRGIFYFNKKGENTGFETDSRSFTEKDGHYRKTKWSVSVEDYLEKNGVMVPTSLRARWHLPKGQYEYFKGTVADVKFNIAALQLDHTPVEAKF